MLYVYFHKRSMNIPLTTGTKREWMLRFEDDWMLRPGVNEIIKELDDSEVGGAHVIISPVLGGIPPERLSATCKNTIMMHLGVKMIFASGFFADEANRLIEQISNDHDVHLYMNHMFVYTDTQVATLVDCDNIVVTGDAAIREWWFKEYDYGERIWSVGWLPGQLERLGLD